MATDTNNRYSDKDLEEFKDGNCKVLW